MERHVLLNADIPNGGEVLAEPAGNIVLRDEREKRRMSREELADLAGVSAAWIRDIETKGERPGAEAMERLRQALEQCPIHRAFGVKCDHKLPVPSDDELYSRRGGAA